MSTASCCNRPKDNREPNDTEKVNALNHEALSGIRPSELKIATKKKAAKERRPFLRRTKATAPPQEAVESETATDIIETTTSKFTRRGNSKFKTPKDAEKESSIEKTRETNETETRTRQPSLNSSATRSDRPTRNFVRRRLGGANSSTARATLASSAGVTRRPFRVASRRRPVSTSSLTSPTSTTASTSTSTTTSTTEATVDDASEEYLQEVVDIGDIDAIEDPTLTTRTPLRNTQKVQRRPLVSLKDEDQNPSATNEEERKRQSKKYSATFKQNQLDLSLRRKAQEDEIIDATTEGKTTVEDISAETAVALAAHQLLAAPIPVIQDYDEPKPIKKTTPVQTTVEYKFTSPEYTEDYSKLQTYTEEYTNTNAYSPDYTQTGTVATGDTFNGLPNTNAPPTYSTIFSKVSRPGYSTNLINPTISGPQNVGIDGSTARYTGLPTDTNPPTTYEFTTRIRPGYSANLITPTASGLTINIGEESTGRYSGVPDTASTFPTIFTGRPSRPAGFSAPSTPSVRDRSTVRYQIASEKVNPSTARYQNSNGPIPVPVDFGYSTDGYSPSQEPSIFTREYLLESPVTKAYDDEYQYLSPITTPQTPQTTTKPKKKTIYRKISTTLPPTTPAVVAPSTTLKPRRIATRKPFEKVQKVQNGKDENKTYRPIANYDYYDDSNEKMVSKYGGETKVVLHGKDTIECLDIGNFPHPTSCKKFISCARIENGSLLGWEYICPKGLSFDPVGGICNWSAGLGCDEKDL